jgi:sigma-B regulation protein RsbU (phosphoserine phosphatase)
VVALASPADDARRPARARLPRRERRCDANDPITRESAAFPVRPRPGPTEPTLRVRLSTAVHSTSGLAREGGDDARSFRLPDGTTCIGVWDAAGHGEAAYIDAAVVLLQLRTELRSSADLIAALRRINCLLFRTAKTRVTWPFVAGFFGVVDSKARVLRYVSCGHETAIVVRESGRHAHLPANAPLLGLDETIELRENFVLLEIGDAIVLASDGVSEARPLEAPRTFFGSARVRELFAPRRTEPEADAKRIIDAATLYSGGKLNDDAAALVMRFD